MFSTIKDLQRDIKNLKESIERLERKNACRDGHHVWEISYEEAEGQMPGLWFTITDSSKPFMRCKHCFVKKESEASK